MEKFLPIKKMQEFLKELGDLMPTDQNKSQMYCNEVKNKIQNFCNQNNVDSIDQIRVEEDESTPRPNRKKNRYTLLHVAAEQGNTRPCKALIDEGANIDSEDFLGKTPLAVAAKKGRKDVVNFLLQNGAEVDSLSKSAAPLGSFNSLFHANFSAAKTCWCT